MDRRTKDNLESVRYIFEHFMKKGDLSAYQTYIAKDAIVHCPGSWEKIHATEIHGIEKLKNIDSQYSQAFQFERVDLQDALVLDDKILVRWSCLGRHKGLFGGLEGTNRPFSVEGQSLYHFNDDGLIAEAWQAWDMYGLLAQIGWSYACLLEGEHEQKLQRLTSREKECLRLLAEGKTAKETGKILFVSPRTVEYYFENIKDKLYCANKRELLPYARLLL